MLLFFKVGFIFNKISSSSYLVILYSVYMSYGLKSPWLFSKICLNVVKSILKFSLSLKISSAGLKLVSMFSRNCLREL